VRQVGHLPELYEDAQSKKKNTKKKHRKSSRKPLIMSAFHCDDFSRISQNAQ
jgi:hypothetical protein